MSVVAQLTEQTRNIVFPSPGRVRDEIPLWMKFYCYEYNSTAVGRVSIKSRSHGGFSVPALTWLKAAIMVPAPTNFEASTNPKYSVGNPKNFSVFPTAYGAGLMGNIFAKILGVGAEAVNKTFNRFGPGQFGYDGVIDKQDTNDLIFKGGGPSRQYEIRLYLPCLNYADSVAAGTIARSFEALSLPTSSGFLKEVKMYHPPLWIFGIGSADSIQIDQDWSGSPQISVLTQVKVRKQALETNALSAHTSNLSFKPVAYSLTLIFREIEPAVRQINSARETGIEITNRSGASLSLGVNIL